MELGRFGKTSFATKSKIRFFRKKRKLVIFTGREIEGTSKQIVEYLMSFERGQPRREGNIEDAYGLTDQQLLEEAGRNHHRPHPYVPFQAHIHLQEVDGEAKPRVASSTESCKVLTITLLQSLLPDRLSVLDWEGGFSTLPSLGCGAAFFKAAPVKPS
ncbi:hypothetical protein Cgig2_029844 [Carnegiea gigantea]|uniref:Uncharacterized protein n=1 Tax=Carnegiea gigantea TaxID=171969 RepID=A0A9Q1GX06_9CARY|nr:hypothetical protein Cgig2_029844 [Carnegiea gigantea]